MRGLLLVSGVLLLAGCGGNNEDFSVDVAMAPSRAYRQLAQLDGGRAVADAAGPMGSALGESTTGENPNPVEPATY